MLTYENLQLQIVMECVCTIYTNSCIYHVYFLQVSSVFCYATSDSALIGVLKDSGVVLNGSAIGI